jgi:hypothetical protein
MRRSASHRPALRLAPPPPPARVERGSRPAGILLGFISALIGCMLLFAAVISVVNVVAFGQAPHPGSVIAMTVLGAAVVMASWRAMRLPDHDDSAR